MRTNDSIRWFEELGIDDVALVGGKNASLGEMYRELTAAGVRVPNGFAVVASAYWATIDEAGIRDELAELLDPIDGTDVADLQQAGPSRPPPGGGRAPAAGRSARHRGRLPPA